MWNQHQLKLLICVAGAMLLSGCTKSKKAEKLAQPVRSAVVEVSQPRASLRFSANVLPTAEVDLSFRVGGYVRSIARIEGRDGHWHEIEPGDPVEAGKVLASIRPTDYQAHSDQLRSQLAEARSAKETAQAQMDEAITTRNQARTNFDRAQVLFENQALIKPDYDEARSALARAEARVAATKSQLATQQARIEETAAGQKEADSALADAELRAPFSGVIVSRKIELGSLATPGTIAFMVADIRNVKVTFGVPDITLRTFQLGQALAVTTESAPGSVFMGRVSSISPSADASSRVYEVEVAVPNPKGMLKAGMIAAVQVNSEATEAPAPIVPLSAIVHTASIEGYGVFVLESRNGSTTARLRSIRLGQMNGRQVTISQGLTPGEHIAEDGGLQLVDGETVREIR